MNNSRRLHNLLDKYLKDTCSNAEMEELFRMIKKADNEPDFKQFFSDYWKEISWNKEFEINYSDKENEEWFYEIYSRAIAREGIISNKNRTRIQIKRQRVLPNKIKLSHLIKIAAVFVVSLFAYFFYQIVSIEHEIAQEVVYERKESEAGEKIFFQLPDGTQVHLNSESSLEYPALFESNYREVHLEGEAYFAVAAVDSHPFLVHTEGITTRVMGTSFNVRSYPDDNKVSVAVASGQVALSNQEIHNNKKHQVLLGANEWANYSTVTHTFSNGSGDISSFTAWNDHVLLYHDKKLVEVAKQLQRWYGVSITFENEGLKHCVIRGEHRNEPLVNVLDAITYAFDMDYQIEGMEVRLWGEGCR